MKFSIIVVSLNAGEKLKKTVDSILRQGFDDYEIIVKDGFSTDDSLDELERDKHLCVYCKKDLGIYDAMNQGIEKARGDYLLFLNCGDYFYNDTVLEKVALQIQSNPGAKIYYGDLYKASIDSLVMSNPKINAFACYRNVPCHQTCFYERELMLEKNYDLSYKVRADYEQFLWSYFCGGAKPAYMNIVVASYEGGGYSETSENKKVSETERRRIVKIYMTRRQRLLFFFILFFTLVSLRKKIAENPKYANVYNRIKKKLYK